MEKIWLGVNLEDAIMGPSREKGGGMTYELIRESLLIEMYGGQSLVTQD